MPNDFAHVLMQFSVDDKRCKLIKLIKKYFSSNSPQKLFRELFFRKLCALNEKRSANANHVTEEKNFWLNENQNR
jgi:hypothetical protein